MKCSYRVIGAYYNLTQHKFTNLFIDEMLMLIIVV